MGGNGFLCEGDFTVPPLSSRLRHDGKTTLTDAEHRSADMLHRKVC